MLLVPFRGISLPYIFSVYHKLQKQAKQPTISEIWECFLVMLRNQILSSSVHLGITLLNMKLGRPLQYRLTLLYLALQRSFIREILFYYIHRLFHHSSLYPSIHSKPHHRFSAPVAFVAQRATVRKISYQSRCLPLYQSVMW